MGVGDAVAVIVVEPEPLPVIETDAVVDPEPLTLTELEKLM